MGKINNNPKTFQTTENFFPAFQDFFVCRLSESVGWFAIETFESKKICNRSEGWLPKVEDAKTPLSIEKHYNVLYISN